MNDQFDELAKGLTQSVARRGAPRLGTAALLCLALVSPSAGPARAAGLRLGPIINLSEPDPFAACRLDFNAAYPAYVGVQFEPYLAVNPIYPNNLVAFWTAELYKGVTTGVSLDGGATWQKVVVPGFTGCAGGTATGGGGDPWLSFAPNGDLYLLTTSENFDAKAGKFVDIAITVCKSIDGGRHWGSPTVLFQQTDKFNQPDKWSITADRLDARFVYAVWDNCANGNRGQAMLSRTTDGGRSWEPARVIYDPGAADNGTIGHIINVLPDGTLVDIFTEFKFSDDGTHRGALLSLIRSPDKGQSWSSPVRVAAIPVFAVTDPETGALIGTSTSYCCPNPAVALDPNNGNLYVVWEDTLFSGGAHGSIAFSMSADGGLTWSAPIQVNKTPANIPSANQQAFIPAVAVAADGTIGVTYYDLRFNDANPGLPTDYWMVLCRPSSRKPCTNPANWGNEVRLTDTSFNMETALNSGRFFVGDYEGLATAGNDFVAVWTQPHGADPDSIFFRRVGP